ncbi:MAG: hypothetical protein ABSA68_03490 [Xanthobacteraceae bacterium]
MFIGLEKLLTDWFGNAAAIGAVSWLQALTWVAAVVAAVVAVVALRRNSLQARATVLLNLHRTWEGLANDRRDLSDFVRATKHDVTHKHAGIQERHQVEHLRNEFLAKLTELREAKDPKFTKFVEYVAFFELVGMYVKNGYIPLRDAMQMYKGPILDIEIVWQRFAKKWQEEAHIPPGLFEHAIFLTKVARTRSKHPVFYWTLYRFRRFFWL